MTSAEPLDIKVIYSATGRRAQPVRVAPTAKPKAAAVSAPVKRSVAVRAPIVRVHASTRGVLALGALNLMVGMVMLTVTWWPVDQFIYQKFVYKTPVDIAALGPMFGLKPEQIQAVPEESSAPAAPQPAITGTAAQAVIASTGYGWLVLSTIAGYALTLAAGTALGQCSNSTWRRHTVIVFMGVLLGLGVAGVYTWQEFQTRFPPDYLRWGMLIGGVAFLLLGMIFDRGVLRWSRCAAVLIIIAAVGSVVGLYLGALSGAIPPAQSSIVFLLIVFAMHSLYGWLLWLLAPRLAA